MELIDNSKPFVLGERPWPGYIKTPLLKLAAESINLIMASKD